MAQMESSFVSNYDEIVIDEYYEDERSSISLIKNSHNSRWLTPEQSKNLWLNRLVAWGIDQEDIPDHFWVQIRRTTFPDNTLSPDDIKTLDNLTKELLILAGASGTLLTILIVLLFIEKSKNNQKPNITIIGSKDIAVNDSIVDKSEKVDTVLANQAESIISVANIFGEDALLKPILVAIHPPSRKILFSPKVLDYISADKIAILLTGATSQDPNERSMAIHYLSYFPQNEDAIKAILFALSDVSPLVRATAADIAGELKIPDSEKKLIELIENPKETPTVKNNAAIALAEIGTSKAIKFLVDAVEMPWENYTLQRIIKANPNKILRPIIKEFSYRNKNLVLSYSHILTMCPVLTLDVCLDMLKPSKIEYLLSTSYVLEMVLEIAWEKLKSSDIKKIIHQCESLISHESFKVRYHAIRILGRLHSQDSIPLLEQALIHNDVNTRAFAAYYLERYRSTQNALTSLIHAYQIEKDKVLKKKIGDLLGKDRPIAVYEKWLNGVLIVLGVLFFILIPVTWVLDALYCSCSLSTVPHPYDYILVTFYIVVTFIGMLLTPLETIRDLFRNTKDEDLFWIEK